jgi:hypothetical protein
MSYNIVDAKDVEAQKGVYRAVGQELGVTAFGINQLELPPEGKSPEHAASDGLAWIGIGCPPGAYGSGA